MKSIIIIIKTLHKIIYKENVFGNKIIGCMFCTWMDILDGWTDRQMNVLDGLLYVFARIVMYVLDRWMFWMDVVDGWLYVLDRLIGVCKF